MLNLSTCINNGTAITAVMVIDGIKVNLTVAVTWVTGQAYVADFTGTLSGSAVTIHLFFFAYKIPSTSL